MRPPSPGRIDRESSAEISCCRGNLAGVESAGLAGFILATPCFLQCHMLHVYLWPKALPPFAAPSRQTMNRT